MEVFPTEIKVRILYNNTQGSLKQCRNANVLEMEKVTEKQCNRMHYDVTISISDETIKWN